MARTITGRTPGNPNLQNVPIRTELGREIREAFVLGNRRVTDEQLRQIADRLIGQCMLDIDNAADEIGAPLFDKWTVEDCYAFDELAFRCSKCEWWASGDDHAEEEPDDFVCSECGNG